MNIVMNNKNLRKNIFIFFRKEKIISCKYCNKMVLKGKNIINKSVDFYKYSICFECFVSNSNCNIL